METSRSRKLWIYCLLLPAKGCKRNPHCENVCGSYTASGSHPKLYLEVWLAWHITLPLSRLSITIWSSLTPCPSMTWYFWTSWQFPYTILDFPALLRHVRSDLSCLMPYSWGYCSLWGCLRLIGYGINFVTNRLPPLPLQGWLRRSLRLPWGISTDTARL